MRRVLAGALAACLAAAAAFLPAVGATAVPEAVDVAVTGIIVGGGSKALHDLMKNVEKAKEKKEDPAEAA